MIPAGRKPADSVRAAQLLGVALGTFRNRKAWRTLPPTLSRPEARQRIWGEEQLLAAIEG
ncbi:DNA recombination protein RmuC, partial [Streptomyces sp. 8K308]